MKQSLVSNASVKKALENIAAKSSTAFDNGSYGKSYKCYLFDVETFVSKEKKALELEIAKESLFGTPEKIAELRKKMEDIPHEGGNLLFKLLEPIEVESTYQVSAYIGGQRKTGRFSVKSDIIKVPLDIAASELISQEELEDDYEDVNGDKVKLITIHLDKCMIDAFGDEFNADGTIWRKKHLKVVSVSRRSMQIAAKANNYMMKQAMRFKGSLSDSAFKDMFGDINPFTK